MKTVIGFFMILMDAIRGIKYSYIPKAIWNFSVVSNSWWRTLITILAIWILASGVGVIFAIVFTIISILFLMKYQKIEAKRTRKYDSIDGMEHIFGASMIALVIAGLMTILITVNSIEKYETLKVITLTQETVYENRYVQIKHDGFRHTIEAGSPCTFGNKTEIYKASLDVTWFNYEFGSYYVDCNRPKENVMEL